MKELPAPFDIPDKGVRLWKYMDLARFTAMLTSNALWFNRADLFEDPYEGTMPKKAAEELLDSRPDSLFRKMYEKDKFKMYRQHHFITCLHMAEHESAAMWDLYATRSAGLAITTNIESLHKVYQHSSFEGQDYYTSDFTLGRVHYIDFTTDAFAPGHIFDKLFLHKRKSFEHEKEVRLTVMIGYEKDRKTWDEEMIPDGQGGAYVTKDIFSNPTSLPGWGKPVKLDDLIKEVYVSPMAPTWFVQTVKGLLLKYELGHKPVIQSDMYRDPVF